MPDEIVTEAPAAEAVPNPVISGSLADRLAAKMAAAEAPPAVAPVVEAPPAAKPVEKAAPVADEVPEVEGELDDTELTAEDLGLPIDAAEEEEVETEADDKSGRAFKTLRTELKAEKAARAQFENQVRELTAKVAERDASTPEVAELQAKIAEYEKTLSVARLESSPAYINAVEKPYQAVIEKADSYADQYEIDKLELTKALAIPDRKERAAKLTDLLVGVGDLERLEILDLGREVERIAAKQTELVANSDKALAELEAEQKQAETEALAARVADRKTTVSKVIPHMVSKLPSFKDAIEKLGPSISETDLDSLPTAKKVYNATVGELFPTVLKDRNRLQRDLESALDELEALKSAAPGSGSGGGGGGGGAAPEGEGFADRLKRRLATA